MRNRTNEVTLDERRITVLIGDCEDIGRFVMPQRRFAPILSKIIKKEVLDFRYNLIDFNIDIVLTNEHLFTKLLRIVTRISEIPTSANALQAQESTAVNFEPCTISDG